MPTKVKDKEVLEKAAGILQRAHDYIEVNGFNIDNYGHLPKGGKLKGAPACYIGTVRIAANVDPQVVEFASSSDAGEGDGLELIEALAAMDRVARRRLFPSRREDAKEFDVSTGRFVEQLGFQVQDKAVDKFPSPPMPNASYSPADRKVWDEWERLGGEVQKQRKEFEQVYALKLLRKALTDIYKDVK